MWVDKGRLTTSVPEGGVCYKGIWARCLPAATSRFATIVFPIFLVRTSWFVEECAHAGRSALARERATRHHEHLAQAEHEMGVSLPQDVACAPSPALYAAQRSAGILVPSAKPIGQAAQTMLSRGSGAANTQARAGKPGSTG